jgi:hypothetical protein
MICYLSNAVSTSSSTCLRAASSSLWMVTSISLRPGTRSLSLRAWSAAGVSPPHSRSATLSTRHRDRSRNSEAACNVRFKARPDGMELLGVCAGGDSVGPRDRTDGVRKEAFTLDCNTGVQGPHSALSFCYSYKIKSSDARTQAEKIIKGKGNRSSPRWFATSCGRSRNTVGTPLVTS